MKAKQESREALKQNPSGLPVGAVRSAELCSSRKESIIKNEKGKEM